MTKLEIAAQCVSFVAMAINVSSYLQKNQKTILAFLFCSSFLFSISYFMLNAPVGAFLNLLSILRSVIFLFKKKLNPMHPLWLCAFIGAYAVSYVLTFTVFQKDPTLPNLLLELLPVIGSISLFVAFRFDSAKWTRRLGLINGPAWLIYNIFYLSVGGIISDSLSILSILIGMLRHDLKKPTPDRTNKAMNEKTKTKE